MKQRKELQRRTPLTATTGLKRSGGLKSSGPVKARRDPCTVDGCTTLQHAKGLCSTHYAADRAGRPLAPVRSPRSTPEEREARKVVRARSGGVCERCMGARATDWHHRKARSQSGQWQAANGLHLCRECHLYVTEHPADAYRHGWCVRSVDNPEHVPCLRRGAYVRLHRDGTFDELDLMELADRIGGVA